MYMPECLLLKENSWGLRNEGCFYVYDCTGEGAGPWGVRIVRLVIEAAQGLGAQIADILVRRGSRVMSLQLTCETHV